MTASPLLARRYARGLYEATGGKADLEGLETALSGREAELSRPRIRVDDVLKMAGVTVSAEVRKLVEILARRKRLPYLRDIARSYRLLREENEGIRRAEITAAVEMSAAAKERVGEALRRKLGAKRMILETKVDPSIIGGLRVRYGDTLVDGSVGTLLDLLRHND